MRQLLIISLVLCLVFNGMAQAPEKINFQTVIHKTEGSVLPNKAVKIIINIFADGTDITYREEHSLQSNVYGIINFEIGTGTILSGSWSDIHWEEEDQYVSIELDITATGNDYIEMGEAKLLSVPYALFANESSTNPSWSENANGIHHIGDVGIMVNLPSADLEFGVSEGILVSSSMPAIADNNLISIGMEADEAQPNINWGDTDANFSTSLSVRKLSSNPPVESKRFEIATADYDFSRKYRMEVAYDKDIVDIIFNDCKFIVDGHFIVGDENQGATSSFWAHQWLHSSVFGMGNKNWEAEGVFANADAEFYANGAETHILLNAADATRKSQLILRRGSSEWFLVNNDVFYVKRNDTKMLKMLNNGNIKIGDTDPNYKLDVFGNVNIPIGYSYMIDGGKSGKYAEYFETEETMNLGDLAGINIETGLIKKYETGDVFIGIVCDASGFIANSNMETIKNSQYVLVGLEGLLEYNSQMVTVNGQQLFTPDGALIGSLVGNRVLMK